MTFVTPYLPKNAEIDAKMWMQSGKPAFTKAYDRQPDKCPNCGGVGVLFVIMADGGPYQSPSIGKVITWFDGNEQFRKGWYTINRTMAYECPECKDKPAKESATIRPTEAVAKRLAEVLSA